MSRAFMLPFYERNERAVRAFAFQRPTRRKPVVVHTGPLPVPYAGPVVTGDFDVLRKAA